MNTLRHTCTLLLCLLPLAPLHAAEPHAHHGHGAMQLSLDHGKQWVGDAPLQQHMTNLRAAFAPHIPAIHKGTLPAASYTMLGEKTAAEVAGMLAECKLEPKADAMLHLLIAEMIAGADILTGKTTGKPAAGAHRVVKALNQYGLYFQHPGWQALH